MIEEESVEEGAMAMEETKAVKKTSSTAVDRLSDLPENLIHEIMSFLSPAEAARMSILSKLLSSAHLSFPLLDFQCRYCHHASPFDQHSVLDSVRNSLQRRRLSFNNSSSDLINNIKSLSLDVFVSNKVGDFLSALNKVTKLLQYLVNFTLFHKIPHVLINCDGDYRHYHEHHRLDNILDIGQIESFPTSLFSAKSSTIKTLNLSGVFFGFQDLMLACPLIEDFHLVDCLGLETIRVSSSAKLIKQIFIQGCSGLQRIDVDSDARLESFSYTGPLFKQSQIININLASPKSVKFLELRRAGITDQWVRNNVFECKSLEILVLEDCRMIKNIRLHDNEHLKDLELKNCNAVECVDVAVAGLESFQFGKRVDYDQPPHCRININCCKRLKNLVISGVVVTEKWIVENLSGQAYLENLEFKSCTLALNNPIKVYLENLKSMEFSGCPRLASLEIESPNLISLRYSGKLLSSPPDLLVSSQNVKVVEIYFENLDNEAEGFYKTLRDFLSCFAHCKRFILHTLGHFTDEFFIYPEQVRNTLIPPLYDVNHLEIQVPVVGSERFLELVDSLLWLAPHLESISFLVGYIIPETKSSIKLYYGVPVDSDDKVVEDDIISCCSLSPVKCWRHYLIEVAIENFEDCVRTSLKSYFIENAKSRITLV